MAKNIFQAKKRVSHFQKTHKDLNGENELFACKDYVSSIIQDMDSNFSSIQLGYSSKGIDYETQLTSFEDIPLLQMAGPSSSKRTLEIPPKSVKTRKFSFSPKHPLWEKSKKNLKQLKHNQNIPKPRAHLAGLPKSPAKSKVKSSSKISVAKKNICNLKNKSTSKPPCNVPSNHSTILNAKNFNSSKVRKDGLVTKHMPKKMEGNTARKSSFSPPIRETPTNADNDTETNCPSKLEIDSNSSDSEFERFIKKQKKDLPKKHSKRQKKNSRKSKSLTRSSKKKKLAHVPDLKDCDSETDSSKYVKISPFKKPKTLNAITDFENDSNYSDHEEIPDALTRDSSSESDDSIAKSRTRSSKRKKLTHVPEQKDSNDCDSETDSSRNVKISPFKKPKIIKAIKYFENDSNCSDVDEIPDALTRDSSSESDDDSIATSITEQVMPKTCELKSISENVFLSKAMSSQSFSVSVSNNSDLVTSNRETLVLNYAPEVRSTGKTETTLDSNLHQSHHNSNVLELNINSDQVQNQFLNETIVNSTKVEPSSQVIDICDSDDECDTGKLLASEICSENVLPTSIENNTMNLENPDSEESDIEIVEVVKPVQTVDKSSASVLTNIPGCLDVVSSKKPLDLENVHVDSKPLIKIENLNTKSNLPLARSQNAEIYDKQDVVYKTDICQTEILEQRTLVGSHCSKTENVPLKGSFKAYLDPTVVKQESGSDDDIIILDADPLAEVVNAYNLPPVKIESIKSEPSTSESKLKILDLINSETRTDKIDEWEKQVQDVIPVSSKELLEWYKMEFKAYQVMKAANADVELSLKNIQTLQTHKMLYVRELLLKCVKSREDTKPSLLQQGENPMNLISSNLQNNCDSAPNNSFSLNPQIVAPSIVVPDIKPDVKIKKEMQSIVVKTEIKSDQDHLNSGKLIPKIESDDKQTLKLLSKKCTVCGKDAVAACEKCAKVFFCSHQCGKKYWTEGHVNVCGTK